MARRFSMVRQPWRKLLYIQQPYPDNHTDSSFLSQLKRNSTVKKHSFRKLCFDFTLISSHFGVLGLIGLVFIGMLREEWDVEIPLSLSTLGTVLIYLIVGHGGSSSSSSSRGSCAVEDEIVTRWRFLSILKSSVLITLGILTLSPVLKSLSESTSSDSIWSLSFWLTCLNLMLNDYQFDDDEVEEYMIDGQKRLNKGFLGMSLLIFNVVLLASRLKTNLEVFYFILFSFQVACFLPLFTNRLRKRVLLGMKEDGLRLSHQMIQYISVVAFEHLLNCWLIYWNFRESYLIVTLCYLVLNLAVLVGCPSYFLMLQKYKDELQGPWDIARPMI